MAVYCGIYYVKEEIKFSSELLIAARFYDDYKDSIKTLDDCGGYPPFDEILSVLNLSKKDVGLSDSFDMRDLDDQTYYEYYVPYLRKIEKRKDIISKIEEYDLHKDIFFNEVCFDKRNEELNKKYRDFFNEEGFFFKEISATECFEFLTSVLSFTKEDLPSNDGNRYFTFVS